MTRLYTFTISHFAEKARWSLDYKGIHYQEKRLVPGSHVPIIKRIAPSTFVPVLQDAGRIIQGSSAIIDYVDEQDLIAAREGEAPLESESLNAVRLMTIHSAKGLEFPVVCVADLGREGKADDIALRVSNDGRVGLELASLAGRGAAALDLEELKREEEERAEAEERRIFYVAMTRAERRLILLTLYHTLNNKTRAA